MLTSDEIKKIIPHRYPMLLVDKVLEVEEGVSIHALKNVTSNEPFFQGHFPEEQVMPGVLVIESLAQAGAIALLKHPDFSGKTPYFAGIDKCRFKRKVRPGDSLDLHVTITKMKGPIGKGQAKAYVDGELAASADLTFALGA
ncbi:MAG: 3-hydroxyacyl-ACP dehydratase FabZ [Bacillota bacterium]